MLLSDSTLARPLIRVTGESTANEQKTSKSTGLFFRVTDRNRAEDDPSVSKTGQDLPDGPATPAIR